MSYSVRTAFSSGENASDSSGAPTHFRRSETTRIKDATQALALCHNVTPVYESNDKNDAGKHI